MAKQTSIGNGRVVSGSSRTNITSNIKKHHHAVTPDSVSVVSSTVIASVPNQIFIQLSDTVSGTKDGIIVTVDGQLRVVDSIDFGTNNMKFNFATDFISGEQISWRYVALNGGITPPIVQGVNQVNNLVQSLNGQIVDNGIPTVDAGVVVVDT